MDRSIDDPAERLCRVLVSFTAADLSLLCSRCIQAHVVNSESALLCTRGDMCTNGDIMVCSNTPHKKCKRQLSRHKSLSLTIAEPSVLIIFLNRELY